MIGIQDETLSDWGYLMIHKERPDLTPQTRLNIIQHPGGETKKFGVRSNHFMNVLKNNDFEYIQYSTHTEAGSSGSPVFTDDWKVIAIHHKWVEVEKHPYRDEIIIYHNQGVFIDCILNDIAKNNPDAHNEICLYQGRV